MDRANVQRLIRELIAEVGEDPSRPGLLHTPERAADALELLTSGYRAPRPPPPPAAERRGGMVIARGIAFYSLCEHHLLPFFGSCHVGYLPGAREWGTEVVISVVQDLARRLQLQERLTEEIADALFEALEPEGLGVLVEGRHLCMMMRGVEKQGSEVLTSSLRGSFREAPIRQAFFAQLGAPRVR